MFVTRFAAVAATAVLLGACQWGEKRESRDSGPVVDRQIAVAAFDRIAVSGPFEVAVKTGGQPGLVAHGGQNFLDDTDIKVEGGTLKIGTKRQNTRWTWNKDEEKVRIEVSAAMLRGAAIAGSGALSIDSVQSDNFAGEIAGSGEMRIDRIESARAKFGIAGSGELTAAGQARDVDISIAGSGDADLSNLAATRADVSIAGSGNVRAKASETVDVSIMGSGNVDVTGGAKCNVKKQGSGDVRCS